MGLLLASPTHQLIVLVRIKKWSLQTNLDTRALCTIIARDGSYNWRTVLCFQHNIFHIYTDCYIKHK